MFNPILVCISTRPNEKKKLPGVSVLVMVAQPAINETGKDGKTRVIVDPNLSANEGRDSIVETCIEAWGEQEFKELLLTRLCSVVSVDRGRQEMIKMLEANPTIPNEQLTKQVQEFYDKNWNVNLKHPVADRSLAKAERTQKEALVHLKSMTKEQLSQYLKDNDLL
tara:strand:- start:73 stop:570 length:498 start_codon:yes stop_codon:yes gene_type:complete